MKHTYLIISISTLFLSCSAAEQQLVSIPLPQQIGIISAISYPTKNNILVGGKGGCWQLNLNPTCDSLESEKNIDFEPVFTIDTDKNKKLCLISNARKLFVYNPEDSAIMWENNDIPTKNISAVFGKKTTIIALDVEQQKILLLDYDTQTQQKYSLDCCKPNWNQTALLSCHKEDNASVKIAYLSSKQEPSMAVLTDPIKPQTLSEAMALYVNEALYSRDGTHIAIADMSKNPIIWNVQDNSFYYIGSKGLIIPLSISFHVNGHLAILNLQALDGQGPSLAYYNINEQGALIIETSNLPLGKTNLEPAGYTRRLTFSPDDKTIAILGDETVLLLPVPEKVMNENIAKK